MVIYIRPVLVFIYGYAIGVLLAYLVFTTRYPGRVFSWIPKNEVQNIGRNLSNNSIQEKDLNHNQNNLNYRDLKNQVQVLCVMFVKDIGNAYVASNTWMWNCNHQLYFGSKSDKYLSIVVIKPSNSWHYLCSVFQHIFDTVDSSYHWILFSKDNNFVIPDNLRQLVVGLNYSDTYYLGHEAFFWNVYFNSGRSSYVVSKGTVDALMNKFTSSEQCMNSGHSWNMEDFYLGKHLGQLGIHPVDTRDARNRARFHVAPINFLFKPEEEGKVPVFDSRSVYKEIQGEGCCSPTSISFPVSSVSSMYFYSYLIYVVHLRKDRRMSNASITDDQVWKEFVLETNPDTNLSTITAEKYYDIWQNIIDPPTIFNQKLRELFLREREGS